MTEPAVLRGAGRDRMARATLLVLSIMLALVLGCREGNAGPSPGGSNRPVPVTVAKVEKRSMPVEVKAIGTVEAFSTVSVQSQVGGELQKVSFNEGDTVTKGQVLFVLDRRPFDAALREAVARRDRNQVLAENAKRELARYEALLGKDYVSKEEYDRAKANVDAFEASLRADKSAVEAASIDLQYATIRAPIEGRTGSLLVHPGNVVKANDKALVVIRQVKPIFVRFSVPEQYVGSIRERMRQGKPPVEAFARERRSTPEQGELTLIENAVDAASGTIELKALFPNAEERLWPGQYVDVVLRLEVEQDAVVAPASAVQRGREGEFVFVVGPDGVATMRKVTVLRTVDELSVIGDGLTPGDVVVTDGQMQLAAGSRVEVKAPGGSSASPSAVAPVPASSGSASR